MLSRCVLSTFYIRIYGYGYGGAAKIHQNLFVVGAPPGPRCKTIPAIKCTTSHYVHLIAESRLTS